MKCGDRGLYLKTGNNRLKTGIKFENWELNLELGIKFGTGN